MWSLVSHYQNLFFFVHSVLTVHVELERVNRNRFCSFFFHTQQIFSLVISSNNKHFDFFYAVFFTVILLLISSSSENTQCMCQWQQVNSISWGNVLWSMCVKFMLKCWGSFNFLRDHIYKTTRTKAKNFAFFGSCIIVIIISTVFESLVVLLCVKEARKEHRNDGRF